MIGIGDSLTIASAPRRPARAGPRRAPGPPRPRRPCGSGAWSRRNPPSPSSSWSGRQPAHPRRSARPRPISGASRPCPEGIHRGPALIRAFPCNADLLGVWGARARGHGSVSRLRSSVLWYSPRPPGGCATRRRAAGRIAEAANNYTTVARGGDGLSEDSQSAGSTIQIRASRRLAALQSAGSRPRSRPARAARRPARRPRSPQPATTPCSLATRSADRCRRTRSPLSALAAANGSADSFAIVTTLKIPSAPRPARPRRRVRPRSAGTPCARATRCRIAETAGVSSSSLAWITAARPHLLRPCVDRGSTVDRARPGADRRAAGGAEPDQRVRQPRSDRPDCRRARRPGEHGQRYRLGVRVQQRDGLERERASAASRTGTG